MRSSGFIFTSVGWMIVAVLAAFWVYTANQQPLFYVDSAGYLNLGTGLLEKFGLAADPSITSVVSSGAPTIDHVPEPQDGKNAIRGNQSIVFSLMLGLAVLVGDPAIEIYFQAFALILAILLPVRAALRVSGAAVSAWKVTALAMVISALGSGSFYVASLMPDIFAPIMILSVATLAILWQHLRIWECFVLFILASGSVLTHPSHLIIAVLLVPLVMLVVLIGRTERWWVAGLLAASIAFVGIAERMAFKIAVDTLTDDNEVVYTPFVTARLIVDGPGKKYLDEYCPVENLATCELNQMLDSPEKITATLIIFSDTPENGSFQLLSPDVQMKISQEQMTFLLNVARDRPFELVFAVLKNTFYQLGLISVEQTIPDADEFRRAKIIYPALPAEYAEGRLAASRSWLGPVTIYQGILYLLSAGALIGLIALPKSRVPAPLRAFGVLVLLAVLVNAFVMGAISQPANRYGARVIFLIPAVWMILFFCRTRWTGAGDT